MTETAIPSARPDPTAVERLRDLHSDVDRAWEAYRMAPGIEDNEERLVWSKAKSALDKAALNYVRTHVLTPSAGVSTDGAGLDQKAIAQKIDPDAWQWPFADAKRRDKAMDKAAEILARQFPASGQGDEELREAADLLRRVIHGGNHRSVADCQRAHAALTALATPAVQPAPDGFRLVPSKPTRDWAERMANARQGQRSTPRCEPPGEADIGWCVTHIRNVLASAPPPPAGTGQAQTGAVRALRVLQRAKCAGGVDTPEASAQVLGHAVDEAIRILDRASADHPRLDGAASEGGKL